MAGAHRIARDGPSRRSGLRAASAALAALAALAAGPLAAQEEGGAPADSAVAPGDTTEGAPVAGDTVRERPALLFPTSLEAVDSLPGGEVTRWGREELLDSSAITLQDFLTDEAPGVLPLRADFYFGPHHLMDGVLGPGAVRVVVDGRELPPLESGQVDLARFGLARIRELTLVRRAGETVLHVTTARHDGGDAYSRISGGTGQPAADLIRGVFTNGAGRRFNVAASLDHLNIGGGASEGTRLDAWGKLSWMPFDDRSGVELLWRNDAVTRTATEEEEFDRGELLLHARSRPAAWIELDFWAGRSSRDPAPALPGQGPPPPPEGGDEAEALQIGHARLGVDVVRGPAVVSLDVRAQEAEGLADLEGELRAGVRLGGGLSVHAAAAGGSWPGFATRRLAGGLAFRTGGGPRLTLRADASTGTRGVARPGRTADSLSVDALSGSAALEVGPYSFSGRATYRKLSRQLPFGADFDAAVPPGPGATVTGLEGRGSGPLLPVDLLEDRIRLRGYWRHSRVEALPLPLYVPADLARGEVEARESFFDGNLQVRAGLRFFYRSPMRSASPGSPEPVVLPREQGVNSFVVIRIDTFRIWWRVDDMRREEQQDFGGLPFPVSRNVFGVRWEFFN